MKKILKILLPLTVVAAVAIAAYIPNTGKIRTKDSPSIDAFARWRISAPKTIFDSKQIFDNMPLSWDDSEVSGSGTTSVFSKDSTRTRMGVALNTAGKRVRQTYMRFNYQPCYSQLVFMTGILGEGGSGITSEMGLMDDNNGLFFRNKDGTPNVVIRSGATGSPIDSVVSQSDWNLDKFNGTGNSGIVLDLSNIQIFFFDFGWLAAGRVRFGFFIEGMPVYCHQFLHANLTDVVYMSTPNLPLRYSIENDGTGAASTVDHICSTVITEGGAEDIGIIRYKSTEGTHIDANIEDTTYAIIGIRLKSTHFGATIKILSTAIQIQTASENGEWTLAFNPTVAGSFTYSDEINSAIQTATGATANFVIGGINIAGGFAQSATGGGGSGDSKALIKNALLLGSSISGTPDEIVLCWRPTGGTNNHDIEGTITWRESM